jgi:hypothetical protein
MVKYFSLPSTSKQQKLALEVLQNELLLELFKFLETTDRFHTFHGLNRRFNMMLLTKSQTYSVNFHSTLKYKLDFFSRSYLSSIVDQITSLRLSNHHDESPSPTDFFFSSGLFLR